MPAETINNSQGKQIIVLIEKVDNLTASIKTLTDKFDAMTENLVIFQRNYYIEHQKVIGDVAKHEQVLFDIKNDVATIERCADELKVRTMPIDDIKRLKEVVFGNGSVGLVGKMDKIQEWISGQVWFQRLTYWFSCRTSNCNHISTIKGYTSKMKG